jgi:hypothetical protein
MIVRVRDHSKRTANRRGRRPYLRQLSSWWGNPIVHQATRMVTVQLGCDIVSAASYLAEHAPITGQELPQVALGIVTARKRFG